MSDVHQIVELARVYSGMPWREWGTSDLVEIHKVLTSLAAKHPVQYTISVLQDEPTEVTELVRFDRLRVFRCPFCEYRFRADPEGVYEAGSIGGSRAGPEGPRVDLLCPNCGQEFEVWVKFNAT